MNNYNGVNEIMSGINSSAVHRLKKTWAVSIIIFKYFKFY